MSEISTLAEECFPEMRDEFEASGLSLDQICRAHRRVPFEPFDRIAITSAMENFKRGGRLVAPYPLVGLRESTEADRGEVFLSGLKGGVFFLSGVDIGASLVVLKVDAGRGLFGGQKVTYSCYLGMGDDRYQPVGTTATLAHALMNLEALYRRFDAVKKAAGSF